MATKVNLPSLEVGDKIQIRDWFSSKDMVSMRETRERYVLFQRIIPVAEPDMRSGLLINTDCPLGTVKLPHYLNRVIDSNQFEGINELGILGVYSLTSGWWLE